MTDIRIAELNKIIEDIDTAGDLMSASLDPTISTDDWAYITQHMFDTANN